MEELIQHFTVLNSNEWIMSLVVVVLIMTLFSLNTHRKQQKKLELSMQLLQKDLRALANAAVGVGGRVLEIERQQRINSTELNSAQLRPKLVPQNQHHISTTTAPVEFYNTSNQPYEQAIRMAQTGANASDIVNVCGLSKSEAELVSMMHRLDKVS